MFHFYCQSSGGSEIFPVRQLMDKPGKVVLLWFQWYNRALTLLDLGTISAMKEASGRNISMCIQGCKLQPNSRNSSVRQSTLWEPLKHPCSLYPGCPFKSLSVPTNIILFTLSPSLWRDIAGKSASSLRHLVCSSWMNPKTNWQEIREASDSLCFSFRKNLFGIKFPPQGSLVLTHKHFLAKPCFSKKKIPTSSAYD